MGRSNQFRLEDSFSIICNKNVFPSRLNNLNNFGNISVNDQILAFETSSLVYKYVDDWSIFIMNSGERENRRELNITHIIRI